MAFTEDSRVKIPVLLHLIRLGYNYISLKDDAQICQIDEDTNIFTAQFIKSLQNINPQHDLNAIERVLEDAKLALDNEDLGEKFYNMLIDQSDIKLIDFDNFHNNSFDVVTELTYKNGDEEFRPDITVLINGMPLIFIEVKKPNNRDGVLAERNRINTRFKNPKFRRFVNLTQMMIFSNNMEYDNETSLPIEGAFYATSSYSNPSFNYFREEDRLDLGTILTPHDDKVENEILKDNNLTIIKNNPEFITNKSPDSPTNRICTSLLNKDRLSFMLQYSIAYVQETSGLEKHIMRYPQIFATKAIETTLDNEIRKGIIWHTQGSGKTALAFYNVRHLKDYFKKKNIVPKFYFIVDRLDLLEQAKREFTARGLKVHTVQSRNDFKKDIKSQSANENLEGKTEITVVNIQKFADDDDVFTSNDYDLSIQRIYFLDEVHRSYNPKGSFLANLEQSDKSAIKIGLTGTPLLGKEYNSKSLFGDYIHKYYYNASIADGYTLRLIREEIESNYKIVLKEALDKIEIEQGKVDREKIYSHENFVSPMIDYIVKDFEKSRISLNDSTIGGMVICDSAAQAKEMFRLFNEDYAEREQAKNRVTSAALILHDIGTKQDRKDWVDDFKAGKIDFLFVYNMLLTGFDAKRLKKLYLGRVIRKHGLLQALTRVNRTYKDFRYGYVVDFADISTEFDATNKAYFEELQNELGSELELYSKLFKSKEEIEQDIEHIKDVLFRFDTINKEIFSQQISDIQDIAQMREIKKALQQAKDLYNLIRLYEHFDLLDKIDFQTLNILYREADNHLGILNLKDKMENHHDTSGLLNAALEDVVFMFKKIGEEELVLSIQLKDTLRKTREALASNFDQKDPAFLTLKEELERLFKKKKLSEVSQKEMNDNIDILSKIHAQIRELNRQNDLLKAKYHGDKKYTRTHKRMIERGDISKSERQIFEALSEVKSDADHSVMDNTRILDNESYFNKMMIPKVIKSFKDHKINLNPTSTQYINTLIVREYMDEFNNKKD